MDQNSPRKQLIEVVTQLLAHAEAVVPTFDAVCHDLVRRLQVERTERRAAIVRADPGNQNRKFCPNVLTYRFHLGTIDLSWTEIFRRKGDSRPLYRRIPRRKGVTHISRVLKGAMPEELDLLRDHEFVAREHRQLWSEYLAMRRAIKQFQASAVRVLGEREENASS